LQGFFANGYDLSMERIQVRENGLVGTLFHVPHSRYVVLTVGGSSGGLNESRAKDLAERGLSSFALAYFGYEKLPPKLKEIPLEYFEKAIDWVKKKTGIEKVGFWGSSRGAELGLILGTILGTKIDAIAAHVPSSAIYGALDEHPSIAAWTWQGKPLGTPAPFVSLFSEEAGLTDQRAIDITPCFLKGMEQKEAFAQAAIRVENICCPLFLISAEDDRMWPSKLFVNHILKRLKEHGSNIQVDHICYAEVGHSPAKGEVGLHPIINRWFAYGGKPERNHWAAKDWVERTVQFFKGRT
jgi:acetyl esterase/lipase